MPKFDVTRFVTPIWHKLYHSFELKTRKIYHMIISSTVLKCCPLWSLLVISLTHILANATQSWLTYHGRNTRTHVHPQLRALNCLQGAFLFGTKRLSALWSYESQLRMDWYSWTLHPPRSFVFTETFRCLAHELSLENTTTFTPKFPNHCSASYWNCLNHNEHLK